MIPFIYIVCIYSESFFGHPCIIFFTIKAQLPLEFSWPPAFVPPSRLHLSQLPWRTSPIKEWLEKANGSLISTRRQETNIWNKLHLYNHNIVWSNRYIHDQHEDPSEGYYIHAVWCCLWCNRLCMQNFAQQLTCVLCACAFPSWNMEGTNGHVKGLFQLLLACANKTTSVGWISVYRSIEL